MSNLQKDYHSRIKHELQKEFGIKNIHAIPRLVKISVSIGLGEAIVNKKAIESSGAHLALITGQKPAVTRAKRDISTFKLRKGDSIGLKVTLRRSKMFDFVEKLANIVLPRIRDFRGVPQHGFDKDGNYSLGMTEQIVFPEIEYSSVDKIRGLQVTFVISAKDAKQSKRLLELIGIPFSKT